MFLFRSEIHLLSTLAVCCKIHNFPVVDAVDVVGDYFDDYGDNEMVEEDD